MKYIIVLLIVLIPLPAQAMTIGDLMHETVSPGKPGFVILEIVGIAIASWIAEMICGILNKNNLANYVKILTAFLGVLLVLITGTGIINKMLAFF